MKNERYMMINTLSITRLASSTVKDNQRFWRMATRDDFYSYLSMFFSNAGANSVLHNMFAKEGSYYEYAPKRFNSKHFQNDIDALRVLHSEIEKMRHQLPTVIEKMKSVDTPIGTDEGKEKAAIAAGSFLSSALKTMSRHCQCANSGNIVRHYFPRWTTYKQPELK